MFHLPAGIVELLDGALTAGDFVARCSLAPRGAVDVLRNLHDAKCLDFSRRTETRTPLESSSVDLNPSLVVPSIDSITDKQLRPGDIVEVLMAIRRDEFTGCLVVDEAGFTMRLDVKAGRVLAASGGPPETGLGPILEEMGQLDAEAREKLMAEAQQNPGVRLEEIALRLGWVNAAYVHQGLSRQLEARIEALVPLAEGKCRFFTGVGVDDSRALDSRPVETVVFDWLKTHPIHRDQLTEPFVAQHADTVFEPTETAEKLLGLMKLGGRGVRLLRQVNGSPLREVLSNPAISRAEASLALHLLYLSGGLRAGESAPPAATVTPSMPKPTVEALPRSTPPPAPPSTAEAAPPAGGGFDRPAIKEAMESRDYARALQLLEVAPSGSADPEILTQLGTATFRVQPGSEKARTRARAILEEALRLNEQNADAFVELAKISRLEGDVAACDAFLRRALSIDPHHGAASSERAAVARIQARSAKPVDAQEPEEDPGSASGKFFGFLRRR